MKREIKLNLSSAEATAAHEILHEFKIAYSGSSEGTMRKMVRDCEKVIVKIEDAVLVADDTNEDDDGEPSE